MKLNWNKVNEFLYYNLWWIVLVIIFVVLLIRAYGNKNKKTTIPAEQKYMNGDLYVNYPPDAYPNFPGSIV